MQGDSVVGGTWDGNPSFVDCGDALLFSQFLALGYGCAELQRPTTRKAPAKGFFGAAMLASSSSTPFDWDIFDSASLVAQDYYSETPHGNLHLVGQADDHPGRISISALKCNTEDGWPTLVIDGYAGDVFQVRKLFCLPHLMLKTTNCQDRLGQTYGKLKTGCFSCRPARTSITTSGISPLRCGKRLF